MESQIQKSPIQKKKKKEKIKKILLAVMAINEYVLMINLVSLLKHT